MIWAQQNQKAPSTPTLKKYVSIALNIAPIALEALKDVSFLPGRAEKHPDRTQLNHKRVTLKLLERPEFQAMTHCQQEVYILRLAKYVNWMADEY